MNTDKLTQRQIEVLTAALECDSITSERLPLLVINNLVQKGLLEYFDTEGSWNFKRTIYRAFITDAGKAALKQERELHSVVEFQDHVEAVQALIDKHETDSPESKAHIKILQKMANNGTAQRWADATRAAERAQIKDKRTVLRLADATPEQLDRMSELLDLAESMRVAGASDAEIAEALKTYQFKAKGKVA